MQDDAKYRNEVIKLLQEAKVIAKRYYQLTGRPLGITGEVAELEAVMKLNLQLSEVRQAGFDAVMQSPAGALRLQIKGRCFVGNKSQRMSRLRQDKEWDAVLLVVLDLDFEAKEMWFAERDAVCEILNAPGSKSRNERGQLDVNKFKSISKLLWSSSDIREAGSLGRRASS